MMSMEQEEKEREKINDIESAMLLNQEYALQARRLEEVRFESKFTFHRGKCHSCPASLFLEDKDGGCGTCHGNLTESHLRHGRCDIGIFTYFENWHIFSAHTYKHLANILFLFLHLS